MNEATINSLKKIGLTEYEARAYLVILNLGQSTAREICEISGIPLSRIYSVMNLLVERGFATTIEGTPTYFIAMDPDPIFTAIRENFCDEINGLRKILRDSFFEINKSSPYWPIYNDRGIEIMLKNLVISAQKEILVMVSDPYHIRPHLSFLKAAKKKVELYVLVPDKSKFVGMGLRIYEMSEGLLHLFDEMYEAQASMHTFIESMKYDKHSDEYFYLIDGIKAISMGYQNKERCATVIRIPTFCYLFRKMISVYEPRID